jgi:hypothetical protein
MNNKPLTQAYLEEVRKRCETATRGPWISFIEGRDHTSGDSVIKRGPGGIEEDLYLTGSTVEDQDFIANARQDIPLLLEEIRRLREILSVNGINIE